MDVSDAFGTSSSVQLGNVEQVPCNRSIYASKMTTKTTMVHQLDGIYWAVGCSYDEVAFVALVAADLAFDGSVAGECCDDLHIGTVDSRLQLMTTTMTMMARDRLSSCDDIDCDATNGDDGDSCCDALVEENGTYNSQLACSRRLFFEVEEVAAFD